MSIVQVACPTCGGVVAVPAANAGTSFRCPKCGAAFMVGSPTPPPPLAVPVAAPQTDHRPQPQPPPLASPAPVPETNFQIKPAAAPAAKSAPRPIATRKSAPRPKVKSARHSKSKPPTSVGKVFMAAAVTIALILLLAGGAALTIWWSLASDKEGALAENKKAVDVPVRKSKAVVPEELNPDSKLEGRQGQGKLPGKNDPDRPQDPAPTDPRKEPISKQGKDAPVEPPPALDPPKKLVEPQSPPMDKGSVPPGAEKKQSGKQDLDPAANPPRPQPAKKAPDSVFQQQVNAAIDRGISFLVASQNPAGSWLGSSENVLGATALAGLTLLECGLPPDHPAVVKAIGFVRTAAQANAATYDLSLSILFVDKLGDKADETLIQTMAGRLLAGQFELGGWRYKCKEFNDQEAALFIENRRKIEATGARPILNVEAPDHGDNSNTQFAMLALWAAGRHDVPVKNALSLAGQRFRATQVETGAWYYSGGGRLRNGSMTCVGLLGLAIGKGSISQKAAPSGKASGADDAAGGSKQIALDVQMRQGMEALGEYMGAQGAQGPARRAEPHNLYFLWSVQRVGVLYNVAKIKDIDWYMWGADMLLPTQNGNGSWFTNGFVGTTPSVDTCLALLFLKRVNLVQDLTDNLLGLQGITAPKRPKSD